jgi:hypothetical protein
VWEARRGHRALRMASNGWRGAALRIAFNGCRGASG